tara:strand:+ start:883 stop:1020 length:138 start_codon:yes stop_codon:yes gene_type:complete
MDKYLFLSGWREDETMCWMTTERLTKEEINKVIDDENFRLHKGIN